jgi:hypothetical protein
VKFKIPGSEKITVCDDLNFLNLFRLKLDEPF